MDSKQDETFTVKDFYRLLLCAIFLLVLFIIPKLHLTYLIEVIFQLIKPDLSHYPYSNPPIFFSIGEAVSSVAILLTIYQVRKEKWRIAFRVRSYIEPVAITSIILGIVCALISSFFSFSAPTNIFETSTFWQVISSLFVLLSITIVFWRASAKNLFSKRTSRKFYEIMIRELSRPTSERLDSVLDTLLNNFENICKAASADSNSETRAYAHAILDTVVGEATLVELLTTKRLDGLHYIIYMIEKYQITQRQAPGIPVIIRKLFLDEESFLYKHLSRDGLAISSNIYESIFESPALLSNFNLFGYPTLGYSSRKNNRIGTRVFITALSKATSTYLKTGQVPARHINEGFEYLNGTFENVCRKIAVEESRGADIRYTMEEDWWTLHDIAQFVGHDYPFLDYKEPLNKEISKKEKTATEASFHASDTINAGVAALIYKAFEHLSHLKKTTDIHFILHQLLEGMTYEENYKEGYRKPFEKRMWEQIDKNVRQRYYPAALRTYLASIIYYLSGKELGKGTGWVVGQAERTRRLLYIDLKPLLDKREKMANDELMEDILLPEHLDYKDGKFLYTLGFGKGPQNPILEPLPGSTSALEGVDTENRETLL